MHRMTVGSTEALVPEDISRSHEPRQSSAAVDLLISGLYRAAVYPSEKVTWGILRKDYGGLVEVQQGMMLREILYDRFRDAPVSEPISKSRGSTLGVSRFESAMSFALGFR